MESSDDGQTVSFPGPWELAMYKGATCKSAELTARGLRSGTEPVPISVSNGGKEAEGREQEGPRPADVGWRPSEPIEDIWIVTPMMAMTVTARAVAL